MNLKKILSVLFFIALWLPCHSIAAECEGRCVLAIGNSLTFHGPDSSIGWHGNWGMAATDIGKDYVSQLLLLLADKSKNEVWTANRQSGYLLEKEPAQFKVNEALIRQSKRANIVIVELGDNYKISPSSIDDFSKTYLTLLNAVRPLNGVIACVSTFWTSQEKNKIIKDNCDIAKGIYVDISGLSELPENIAGNQQSISHKGVAGHPGDIGMRAIAERIYKKIPH